MRFDIETQQYIPESDYDVSVLEDAVKEIETCSPCGRTLLSIDGRLFTHYYRAYTGSGKTSMSYMTGWIVIAPMLIYKSLCNHYRALANKETVFDKRLESATEFVDRMLEEHHTLRVNISEFAGYCNNEELCEEDDDITLKAMKDVTDLRRQYGIILPRRLFLTEDETRVIHVIATALNKRLPEVEREDIDAFLSKLNKLVNKANRELGETK